MALSTQQQAVVDFAVAEGGHLNLIARAGCGKTYTLLEVVKGIKAVTPNAEIALVAYNRSIANELDAKLKEFNYGNSVRANTMHSVGNSAIGYFLKTTKGIQGYKPDGKKVELIVEDLKRELIQASQRPGLSGDKWQEIQDKIEICENQKGFVTKAVSLAKQRAFGVIHPVDQMDKWYELIEHFGLDQGWDELEMKHSESMIKMCVVVYNRSLDQVLEGKLDFDDQILAPLFYRCKFFTKDFVLVDEAQDLNPARRLLAIRMAGSKGRIICVGDPCQPLGTKVSVPGGTVNIENIKIDDMVISYRPSDTAFLMGGRKVTGITLKPYSGKLVIATDTNGRVTKYTPNHKCLVNFNSLRDKHAVYLMRRGNQYRVGKCSMSYKESSGLSSRLRSEKADAAWVLSVFDTEAEAFFWEQSVSGKFGIPQLMFDAGKHSRGPASKYLPKAWEFIGDNRERGEICLFHFNRHPNYPLFTSEALYQSIKRPLITHASNLMSGVMLLPFEGKAHTRSSNWVSVVITEEGYEGDVISLDVEDTHLYVADGFVTHNCQAIYGFTGADSDSMDLMKSAMGSQELPLNLTYRCPKSVVAVAQQWVPDFMAHESNPEGLVRTVPFITLTDEKTGEKALDFSNETLGATDVILCRNTKPLVELAWTLIRRKVACRVEGRDIGQGLIQMAKRWKVVRLDAFKNRVNSWAEREIAKFRSKDREDMIQSVEDKADTIICIIDGLLADGKRDVSDFEAFVTSLFGDTRDGEVQKVLTLSTVHKSKGREWDRVYWLFPELCPSKYAKKEWELAQEKNLCYVCVTRSKSELIFIEV